MCARENDGSGNATVTLALNDKDILVTTARTMLNVARAHAFGSRLRINV
jgi:hypothetical protein